MLFRQRTSTNEHYRTKMVKTVFVMTMSCLVLLTSAVPLQAGRNLFKPDKTSSSDDSDGDLIPVSKIRPDQLSKMEQLSQSLQQGNSKATTRYYLLCLGVIVLSLVLIYLLQKFYYEWEEHLLDDPKYLFQELCKAHQLTKSDQQILQEIGKKMNLPNLLPVFIEPQHLKSALEDEPSEKMRSAVESLLEKLFDIAPKRPGASSSVLITDTTILFHKKDEMI